MMKAVLILCVGILLTIASEHRAQSTPVALAERSAVATP
jgi:hypothetical protein